MKRLLLLLLLLPLDALAWDLGDLTAYSSRFGIHFENQISWSYTRDSVADLQALGWTTVNVSATDCAANNDATDQLALNQAICQTVCGGTWTGGASTGSCSVTNCGKKIALLRTDQACQFDMLATSGGVDSAGGRGLYLAYNELALAGRSMFETKLYCNNTNSGVDVSVGPCIDGGGGFSTGAGPTGNTYNWTAGSTADTTSITLATCSGLAAGDVLGLTAPLTTGESVQWQTGVVSVTGSGPCTVVIERPLLADHNVSSSSTDARNWGSRQHDIYFFDLDIGFPLVHDGLCSSTGCYAAVAGVATRFRGVARLLFNNVNISRYGATGLSVKNSYAILFEHGIMGHSAGHARRGTGMGFVSSGAGFTEHVSLLDNYGTSATGRISGVTGNSFGDVVAYNYEPTQTAVSPDTGDYCTGVTSADPNYPVASDNPPQTERSLFFMHDVPATDPPYGPWLIEANDTYCKWLREAGAYTIMQGSTYFRNRMDRGSVGSIQWDGGGSANPNQNWILNRVRTMSASTQDNALVLYNTGTSSWSTPTGTGVTSSGNQTTTSTNSSCPRDIPASLLFRQDTPPDWFCVESLTNDGNSATAIANWQGGWTYGACDGQGGVTYKLPAQIRAEGGTCTPVTGAAAGNRISGGGGSGVRF